jgi:UDP-N-acetylglucosamine--dolichyl-phosphate N-acetylglucosaminephosphotransferase
MSILPFISAFILTFFTTPPAAKFLFKKGFQGVDLHKEGDIRIPEMGGVAVYFSVLVVLVYYYMAGEDLLLAPIFAFYIIGVLGIIDGFTRLSAAQKVTSFFVVGVFLAWGLGFRGTGPVLLIGFLYMCAVNFTNMLAGFNGLEIGTGTIASAGIALVSFFAGNVPGFTIASAMAGGLFAFLYFNRFPAVVFPGDVGTLIIGSALFAAILLGGHVVSGLLVFIPYLTDAALKFFSAGVMTRESQKPTQIKSGKLHAPEGTNLSLARLFLKRGALTEKEVVHRVWAVEGFFIALAISYEVFL